MDDGDMKKNAERQRKGGEGLREGCGKAEGAMAGRAKQCKPAGLGAPG